jgi:hypothetical protein
VRVPVKQRVKGYIEEEGAVTDKDIIVEFDGTDPFFISEALDDLVRGGHIERTAVAQKGSCYETVDEENVEEPSTVTNESMTQPEDDLADSGSESSPGRQPEDNFSQHAEESVGCINNALGELTGVRAYSLSTRELLAVKIAQLALRDASPHFHNDNLADNPDLFEGYV